MFFRKFVSLSVLTAATLSATLAWSGEFSEDKGVAMGRFDAVSYFKRDREPVLGVRDFSTEYKGSKFYFISNADLQDFVANPEKYAPQFGGFCAYNAAEGKKLAGSPRIFAVADGKLYLFSSTEARSQWKKDVIGNVARANERWPDVSQQLLAKGQ